jgi:hypothetical protein
MRQGRDEATKVITETEAPIIINAVSLCMYTSDQDLMKMITLLEL